MENKAQEKINVNKNQEQIFLPKKPWHTQVILLFGIGAITIFLIGAILFVVKDKLITDHTQQENAETTTQSLTYPQKNILVYTRCFGGSKQFTHCKLYSSNLKEPDEQVIYTFNYPNVEQTDYEVGFTLSIDGVSDKKVVYTQSYWEKNGDTTTRTKKIGYISLGSGSNQEIFTERDDENSGDIQRLVSVYVDEENGRVYYTTHTDLLPVHQLVQYNLDNNTSTVLADNNNLDFPSIVLGASKSRVYLSAMGESPFDFPAWTKTLDLESKRIDNVSEPLDRAVFDQTGEHVAYIETNQLSDNLYDLFLVVANTDGTDKKVLRTISRTSLSNPAGDYSFFTKYYFNTYGDILNYTIYKQPDSRSSNTPEATDYISVISAKREIEPDQKGIHILPPDNPEIYKTVYTVEPSGIEYKWIRYHTFSGPLEGNIGEGVVYETEGGWFFNPLYRFDDNTIDLVGNRRVIAVQANNLHLIRN